LSNYKIFVRTNFGSLEALPENDARPLLFVLLLTNQTWAASRGDSTVIDNSKKLLIKVDLFS